MAVVQGVKEKVHLPIYDCIYVKPGEQLREITPSSTLKFFVDVQGKTKLLTNLQAAQLLPHYNTFEARAMRVVISDLPPVGSKDVTVEAEDLEVLNEDDEPLYVASDGTVDTNESDRQVLASLELGLDRALQLLQRARADDDDVVLDPDDDAVTLQGGDNDLSEDETDHVAEAGGTVTLTARRLEELILDLKDTERPPIEQLHSRNGSGSVVGKLIYNTVTTFYVGEKVMIQMPTWFFPSGAGPYSQASGLLTHGEPNPMATFKFAEPVFVDRQQNFRVEMEVPDTDTWKEIQRIYGPLYVWIVLDGYMTRDVQ